MENKEQNLSFEEAMARLEEIVEELEKGEAPLELAIKRFQEGMELSRLCGEKLRQAEQQVNMLIESGDRILREPFDPLQEDKGDSH